MCAIVATLVLVLSACGGADLAELAGEASNDANTTNQAASADTGGGGDTNGGSGGSLSTGTQPTGTFEIGETYTLTVGEGPASNTLTIPGGSITSLELEGAPTNVSDVTVVSADFTIAASTSESGSNFPEAAPIITAYEEPMNLVLSLQGVDGDVVNLTVNSQAQPDAGGQGDAPDIITDAVALGAGQTGLLGGQDSGDMYSMELEAGDIIDVSLTADPTSSGGVSAQLLFNGQNEGSTFAGAGGTEELRRVTNFEQAGTWYVLVTGGGTYQLAASVGSHPDGGGGFGDAGDGVSTAIAVESGTFPGLMGDDDSTDFYTFDLAAGALVNVSMSTMADAAGTMHVRVLVNGAEEGRISPAPGGTESMSLTLVNDAGTAVLEVWGADGGYEIDLDSGAQSDGGLSGDAGEDGNAAVLDGPGEFSGQTSRADAEDHYRIPVEAGPLTISFTTAGDATRRFNVRLMVDEKEVDRIAVNPGSTDSFTAEIESAGDVRLELWGGLGSYTVDVAPQ